MAGTDWSLQALGISPYRGNAYDLRVDLNYRNLQQLPTDLFSLGELQWLNLNVNKLKDLPAEMAMLGRLKWLYLENNSFQKCPEVVCKLTELVRLYFSCNSLTELPRAIVNLTHLRWIDLSDNRFAEFPTVLCSGSLACLEKLFLDNNQITSLPNQIASMKSLKLLWINDNRLEWLPHALCELTCLEDLQLKNNPLRCLPVFLASKLSNLKIFEWQECPLIQQLTEACQKGIQGLGEHQDQIIKKAEKRRMVHFRTEAGLDGGRERPCYLMRTRPRGVAVIIDNFCTLEAEESLNGRASSQSSSDGREDAKEQDNTDRLRSVLIKLGFNVRIMRGLMSLDIISALRFLSLEDHSYFDCVIVCILSRGARGGKIIGPDGIAVEVQQLTDIFSRTNCPTLADKPKLFFLQILEGNVKAKLSPRVHVSKDTTIPTTPTLIPNDYDFLLTFALIPKEATSDSLPSVYHFYVGVLFDMLETFARKLNLLDLMTTVHGEVKKRRLRSKNSPEERVQISPEIQTTLRYNLYLSMGSPSTGQGTSGGSKSVPSSRASTMLS
ncbi:caspase-2-like [Patiria miniata]|uniref:Uncharacterized protein n=1 Tax=Patiria miniata TaxID=46514 RepID=A0A914B095_PATMI|nr:caspase-2-like [Patiria miniata]